jgi:succinyl-CoA:(S)-malate CoA-transferase subunit B
MERGIAEGRGAVAVGGEMVDLANIKLAENTLAKAEAIAALERMEPPAGPPPTPHGSSPSRPVEVSSSFAASNGRPSALEGIRVLDIATFIAAPFAAAALGEFGAEVIKVEKPGVGDYLRELGTRSPAGDTYNWLNEARNKKCITLDLRQPRGAGLFRRLVADADVVMENFRPGTLEKWGLGYEALKAVNPGVVLLRVSGYGQTGPKAQLPGFARIAHAYCGLTYLTGQQDTPPLMPGSTTLADFLTGIYGAFGVLVALRARERTGEGQVIDIGLYEPMFRFLDELAPVYAATGHVRERMGADTYNSVPHSHYPTRGGQWVAIACTNDKMFARFAGMIGKPELAHPERFGRKPARVAARAEVNRIVAEWTGTLTREEVVAACAAGEVPCGPINSIADIFADEHFAARGDLVRVNDPRAGEVVVPAPMPFLSGTPARLEHLGAAMGAHNEEIFLGQLGLAPAELEELKAAGVV